jgi:hypothetical protein
VVSLLAAVTANAQTFRLTGHLVDSETGESVLYANCIDENTGHGAVANNFGYFSLTVGGKALLKVSCIGYATTSTEIALSGDTTVTISVTPQSVNVNEVVVSATVPVREQVMMGKNTLTLEMIKSIPSFLAEPDLIKTLAYLPGISLGREGYSNIFVRGGDRGQNLALLDGIKIYNISHVGGFLSLFNSDIVKSVDVYKGGFPAQYGGRTAAVIDVATKDGNSQRTTGSVTLGTLTSSAIIESPLGKKVSFYLAGRVSYYDLLVQDQKKNYEEAAKETNPHTEASYSGFSFFDVNSKIRWSIDATSSLTLAGFLGNDYQQLYSQEISNHESLKNTRYKNDYTIRNRGVSLTYAKSFGRLFWRNTVSTSKYDTKDVKFDEDNTGFEKYKKTQSTMVTEIKDATLQSRLEYDLERHKIKGGVELNRYSYNPGLETNHYADSIIHKDSVYGTKSDVSAWENSIYLGDEIRISSRLSVEAGVRGTIYSQTDTTYRRIEPRLSARYMLNDNTSVKANYTLMNQFNHVLVNNNDGMEEEIWLASNNKIRPQQAHQVSAGVFYGNDELKINASAEIYYKLMNNLIEYHPPVTVTHKMMELDESVYHGGKGVAYGLELMVSKDFEKLTMSLTYTLSKNERKFDEINNGKWYPFIFDRRHDLGITAHYRFNKKWTTDANFVYSSGHPTTLPVGKTRNSSFSYGGDLFNGLNNYRLPAYHRLDLGVKRYFETDRGLKSQLSLNIYNVYARQNAVMVFYRNGKLYQKSLFTIIPTISYTITL